MKKAFYAGLCYVGIRGGAIGIRNNAVIYKNQTFTLPDEYKHIEMPLGDICKIEKGRLFLFPTVTIQLKNHRTYKFIVFCRKSFLRALQSDNN